MSTAMPWTPEDALSHTKQADTPELQALWTKVANATLERTGNDKTAIREANAAIDRSKRKAAGRWV